MTAPPEGLPSHLTDPQWLIEVHYIAQPAPVCLQHSGRGSKSNHNVPLLCEKPALTLPPQCLAIMSQLPCDRSVPQPSGASSQQCQPCQAKQSSPQLPHTPCSFTRLCLCSHGSCCFARPSFTFPYCQLPGQALCILEDWAQVYLPSTPGFVRGPSPWLPGHPILMPLRVLSCCPVTSCLSVPSARGQGPCQSSHHCIPRASTVSGTQCVLNKHSANKLNYEHEASQISERTWGFTLTSSHSLSI